MLIFGTLYVSHRFLLKKWMRCCILTIETEGYILTSVTDKQKDSLKEYIMSMNQLVISLLERDME